MSSESETAVKSGGTSPPLKSLGKYLIERKLGQGGMGTVYLAKHTELKKLIALKVLPQDKAKNPILVRRFKAEAQAAAQLEHPNIVAVYDSGEADGYLYIAMEYVDGIDLFEQVKRRGVIPVKRSIDIIKQVAAALQEASEKNIVHRDIKPSNLLLRQDGVVKVTDLGLARSIDDTLETNITRAGTTVGTVDYMAPEQARNSKSADIRSDIYSLGCTWYQMLTGEPPFPDGSLTNKLQAHAIKPLPDPREKNENIPEGLFAVLQRMTAKKPEDRYQTPAELLEDLSHAKLTKAAFSNEIFSDLSDTELSAGEYGSEDEDGEVDDDDEGDFEPSEDERPSKKKRSRVEEQVDDSRAPARRKKRSRDRDEVEDDDVDDEPTHHRTRSRDAETIPADETQPSRPRHKPLSKPLDEDDDDEPTNSRPAKRVTSAWDDDDDEDESSPAKRKKNSHAHDEGKTASKSKQAAANDKKPAKSNGPKPLPPKRQPIQIEIADPKKSLVESLKYFGIVAGVLLVIGGLGLLVSRWGSQVEMVPIPAVNPGAQQNADTGVPKATNSKEPDPPQVTVNVVDPSKQTTTAERPQAEYDIAKQPVPAWATADAAEPRDLPAFTAGPGGGSPTHFPNLNEALQAADKNGGLIRLIGSGPFLMSGIELTGGKKIAIAAATPQDQPLIILKPDESGAVAGLTLNRGTLDLRGLHFVWERKSNPATQAAPTIFITVVDGQLFARNCSFTATGDEGIDATALSFLSKLDAHGVPTIEPDVLVDRVVTRGNGLAGLRIEAFHADVVMQDSLLITGRAPCLDIASLSNLSIGDSSPTKPRRLIRALRSTLIARSKIVEFTAEGTTKPPTTSVLFQDSICSAEGSGNSTVLASAVRWPSVTSSASGWLTNLSWTSVSSLYLGFDRLLDFEKTSYKVANLDAWQRVWGKKFVAAQFQPIFWQESTIADITAVLPYDFDPAKLPYHDLKSTTGGLPGCPIAKVKVPDVVSQERLFATSQRPKLPMVVLKPADGPVNKKIDLAKDDLGKILNRNDWQSGAVFEASGSGLRYMSPVKIIGKSVRVIFKQGDGAPLKLQPIVPDQKSKPEQQALFNIENGTLDLQSVVLEVCQAAKPAAPPWLINARNASVILRGCQLNGPLILDLEQQHQGLIQWTTTGTTPPPAGVELPFLSVDDCLLRSPGIGIRTEFSQGNVFIRNSIIAVRGNGLSVLPIRAEGGLAANIDLKHVTFSTSKAAVLIDAGTRKDAAPSPARIFVDYCAFVPPLEFKPDEAAESAVVECIGPVREHKQVEWWANSNAVARDVKALLRQSGADPITTAADWNAAWGESHVIRMLVGGNGVRLKNSLANKWANLKSNSFALDPKSPSGTWADAGRPVGADAQAVEDALAGKKAVTETKGTAPQPATQKVNPKGDVGF